MAYAQTTYTSGGLFAGLISALTGIKDDIRRRWSFVQSVHTLGGLTDRQLRDIGIPREQINRRAYLEVYHSQPFNQPF
ncbi:DUF1127 domain-containing protein [Ruegeria sp.]|uniref:DUF1127 domain-containing protein n=1 Tax=Ruegeria sp. TaxID=1879320 RepID=UPI00231F628C|nr:DUF1127 domain-containing protein [Ruegeria sp.]MDA7966994.1 DUF1127 domain-containing protein [Ruegeria sp.]